MHINSVCLCVTTDIVAIQWAQAEYFGGRGLCPSRALRRATRIRHARRRYRQSRYAPPTKKAQRIGFADSCAVCPAYAAHSRAQECQKLIDDDRKRAQLDIFIDPLEVVEDDERVMA